MIDQFYSGNVNLIIPIRYAYCYCTKDLAGFQSEGLEAYRKKLLDFSNSDLATLTFNFSFFAYLPSKVFVCDT